MFIIQNTGTGKYVAQPGDARSYTNRFEDARTWASREAAEKERCVENEVILDAYQVVAGMAARIKH